MIYGTKVKLHGKFGSEPSFWKGRNVFITGHTGFKGGWLALLLNILGANVYGYSLDVNTEPNFFNVVNLKDRIQSSTIGDIRNLSEHKVVECQSPQ